MEGVEGMHGGEAKEIGDKGTERDAVVGEEWSKLEGTKQECDKIKIKVKVMDEGSVAWRNEKIND